MNHGFFRCACASPRLVVADCEHNARELGKLVHRAQEKHVKLLVFPELSLTGYTCADLFLQQTMHTAAIDALEWLCKSTADCDVLFVAGLPFALGAARYNCAAYIHHGTLLALVPKTFIPTYSEFYERRWFAPAPKGTAMVHVNERFGNVPFGTAILLCDQNNTALCIGTEICEDVWMPQSPSVAHTLSGATVIANLSASNEVVGKADYRRLLVRAHSAKTVCAYVYADSGRDESSTDMVFAGHNIIAENGTVLAESAPFETSGTDCIVSDIDVDRIVQERRRITTFADAACDVSASSYMRVPISFSDADSPKHEPLLYRHIEAHPFVPEDSSERGKRCEAVIALQSEALAKRLRHIHCASAVIGLSGGLDSTLALLVTARAFDLCGIDKKNILAVTMPCFGTTTRTYTNACQLAQKTGATLREINITASVLRHFSDIGHDEHEHDVTYENCQARERTQVLMDLANKTGGIVIGTGDLSELALGWCTYNGDHMSMYGVNASIPKTLVRHLVRFIADGAEKDLSAVLHDILDTPVSPELLPPADSGISQKTEELVGPYELHDFFLYHVLRWGFSPKKIFFLACHVFEGKTAEGTGCLYTREVIFKWLSKFYLRFFSQQFKRNCMPDGAKIGTVNLSPRGDWRMPSDASVAIWKSELDSISKDLRC